MPLDHYISQVYLRNFYSPNLGERMYAIRKDDLKEFTPNSESVCRIENGNTNAYLRDDRIIEEFLKAIEPKYNDSLNKLETENIDRECIYTIAGFIAFVSACSPTGMRIYSEPLKNVVENTMLRLDAKGLLCKPPPELGISNLTELLNNKKMQISIDPKYPQSIGISQILSLTVMLGNFPWEILQNKITDSPFFTSDYPIAIEETINPRILNKIVPLSPNLAIRICPDPNFKREKADFTFSQFTYRNRTLNRKEVTKINSLIVQSAESMVFFRDNHDWVHKFITKNRAFRIEPHSTKIKTNNGTLLLSTQKLTKVEEVDNQYRK